MKVKNTIIIVIIAISLSACNEKPDKPVLKKNNSLIIGNPFDYGIASTLIFPVGSNYKPVVYESEEREKLAKSDLSKSTLNFVANGSRENYYDRAADIEYKNQDEDKFDIRNILFYDLKTGESYPLVNDTLHILSFAMHKEFPKPMIFYRVVKNDYNKDSIFNSKDPIMLFVSDLYGKGFKQITPADEQFVDYTYYKQTNTILIKTIIDNDKDKDFTNYDETNFSEMKINEPTMALEIFKKSLKDSLRNQLKAF